MISNCLIQSLYDIWFLKCKVQQTEIFVILGHFLSFQPTENPENQNFKIEKKKNNNNNNNNNNWRYYNFTHLHNKWQSFIWCMVHDIWSVTDRIFYHSGPFICSFTLWTQKIKIMKKWKKCMEILPFYTGVPQM